MQKERQPESPLLNSMPGFKYCDLLLEHPSTIRDLLSAFDQEVASDKERQSAMEICREVRKRAKTTLKWVKGKLGIHDEALDHLTLGRTWLLEAVLAKASPTERMSDETADQLSHAEQHLNESVSLLRQAGMQEYIARGLLSRAALWRVQCQISYEQS